MVALGCQGRYKGHWWFDCLVFRNPDARERSSVRYPGDPSGRYAHGLRRCSVQAADHSPLATESRGAVRGAIAALCFWGLRAARLRVVLLREKERRRGHGLER